jgi:hypothetical protein
MIMGFPQILRRSEAGIALGNGETRPVECDCRSDCEMVRGRASLIGVKTPIFKFADKKIQRIVVHRLERMGAPNVTPLASV